MVGTGSAASCTFGALQTAVTKGGIVTFDCGSAPVTLGVTSTLNVPVDKNTVIDGGGLVTLDGGGAVQILSFNSPGWQTNTYGLTLQHIALVEREDHPHAGDSDGSVAVLPGVGRRAGRRGLHARRVPHRHRLGLHE